MELSSIGGQIPYPIQHRSFGYLDAMKDMEKKEAKWKDDCTDEMTFNATLWQKIKDVPGGLSDF